MILERINTPLDLRKLKQTDLPVLAEEIRGFIIENVSKTGGHLAPSLGAVDLIIALHYCLNTPKDTIVWDVGHQAYAHKIITGRKEKFSTLRQKNGISGFPNINESEYDPFTVGHGSTSISTAMGLAAARDLANSNEKITALIGDGSLGGGMAFEALNHAGQLQKDILIVLNDNKFSISHSVGAFSKYLGRVITNPTYNKIRHQMQELVGRIPKVGLAALKTAKKLEESLKNILVPGIIFEEMGIRYFGPVDGHDINAMINVFNNIIPLKEPRIIHIITKKGKGYKFAEKNPPKFHGTTEFSVETGLAKKPYELTFTGAFSNKLLEIAEKRKEVVAITAAMPEGTGLIGFSEKHPDRFFDVGMAEQHAVGFAAGLAKKGFIPITAIYSTFLQRAYDQIVHDIALQNLHVVLCLDRAGIVGEDGATHHGVFDMAYLRHIPNMTVMAAKDQKELMNMLEYAVEKIKGPVAIRYPRGRLIVSDKYQISESAIECAKAEILRAGADLAIISIGCMALNCLAAAHILAKENIHAQVINARFVKPIDEALIKSLGKNFKHIITVEDGCLQGGFGSAVLETINKHNIYDLKIKTLGIPDKFIAHAKRDELIDELCLGPESIAKTAKEILKR